MGKWGKRLAFHQLHGKVSDDQERILDIFFFPEVLSFTVSKQTHKYTFVIQWKILYVVHIEVSDSRHFKDVESHFSLWIDCFVRVTNLSWLPGTFLALDLKGHVPENPLVLEKLGWLVIWLIFASDICLCRRKRLPPESVSQQGTKPACCLCRERRWSVQDLIWRVIKNLVLPGVFSGGTVVKTHCRRYGFDPWSEN